MTSSSKWKEVPLPERMRNLPKDPRGYPIPANILQDDEGVYHFIINDENKRQEQIRLQRCAICDGALDGEFWFVGGPLSGLHPNGAYIDTAQHYECVTYALQVCPYLATRPYKRPDPEKVASRVKSKNSVILVDPTMMPGQPELFILVMSNKFDVLQEGAYVRPTKVLKTEAWLDGVRQENLIEALSEHLTHEHIEALSEAGVFTIAEDGEIKISGVVK